MQAILLSCQLLLDPGRQHRDRLADLAEHHLGGAPGARRAQVRGARPQPGRRAGRSTCRRCSTRSTTRTRAIFVNSPGNPTGWTMTVGPAARAARVRPQARRLDHGRRGLCPADLHARRRAVVPRACRRPDDALLVLNSFSKPWAMTGWRIGWLTHPPALGDQLAKLVQINTSGVAGLPAARRDRGAGEGRGLRQADGRALPRRRRAGVPAPVGQSAGHDRAAGSGLLQLLLGRRRRPTPWPSARSWRREYKVGLAPGEAFAAGGQGNIRLCFASGAERLSKGLDRIEAAIKAL